VNGAAILVSFCPASLKKHRNCVAFITDEVEKLQAGQDG